jgi:protein-S-isoprenylcysteine O-methyltransferase Ste14
VHSSGWRTPRGVAALLYGAVAYILFARTAIYLIGFTADRWVAKTLDRTPGGSALFPALAVAVDLALLLLFCLHHSVLARPATKRWLGRHLDPMFERSSYVLASSLLLALLIWQWQPWPAVVWAVGDGSWKVGLQVLSLAGWALALISSRTLGHFKLYGLRQIWLGLQRRRPDDPLRTQALYGLLRHPMYLGFLLAIWATPTMTAGHLLFAATLTGYVLVALRWEEGDLAERYGEAFAAYRRRVPRFLPWPRRRPPPDL